MTEYKGDAVWLSAPVFCSQTAWVWIPSLIVLLTLLTSLSLCDLICRMRIKTITCLKFIVRLK